MAKNDKDRLIGRSKSQTLLRRSGLFRKTGGYSAAPAVIQCLYLLNDDGTLATEFGYGYAGPAVNDGLTLSVDIIGGHGIRVLLPANKINSKLKRGLVPVVFEADLISATGDGGDAFVGILIISAVGVMINCGTLQLNNYDIDSMEVQTDGEVTGSSRIEWLIAEAPVNVSETDYFIPCLLINENEATTGHIESRLIVSAAQMTQTHSVGAVDIYGVEI